MLVYTSFTSPRLSYIIDFFSNEIFEKPVKITTDLARFKMEQGPKINYGRLPVDDNEFRVCPVPLLSETTIAEQEFNFFEVFGYKGIFPTYGGDFPFDIFSAVFYFISRYEEYLPHEKDKYGRYSHLNSLAYREKFLDVPLVDIWLFHFRKALVKKYPEIQLKKRSFSFLPTYDIDIAYSYSAKGRKRSLAGSLKALATLRFGALWRRFQVLQGKLKDPFDAYSWLDALHKSGKHKPVYFFLVADKNRKFDKNILPEEPLLQQLIKRTATNYQVGIHPGWNTYGDLEAIKSECETLKKLSGITAIHSRQHYIRMNLPETYHQLMDAGIKEDYSMGYGTINGFRASCSLPFYFYDLLQEKQFPLLVHPFCFMDANAYYQQKLSTEKTAELLNSYADILMKHQGVLTTIWHNQFLGTEKLFAGWREVYEQLFKKLSVVRKQPVQTEA